MPCGASGCDQLPVRTIERSTTNSWKVRDWRVHRGGLLKTREALKAAILIILRAYKRFISPLLPGACRFEPTCSEYMAQAIEKNGILRGVYLGFKRLMRCHPFCDGGLDPVP